jgi:hypothetical protein
MKGNITRRGKTSSRVKFDVGFDPITGKRKYHTETLRGAKSDAVNLLAKRISEQAEGQLVERTALPLATFARHWLSVIAPVSTSPKTRERYAELIEQHIIPRLGAIEIQKLHGPRIDAFYNHLLTSGRRNGSGGLSAQTVRHIHRLLSQILSSAVKAQKLRQCPRWQCRPRLKCGSRISKFSPTMNSQRCFNISRSGPSTCRCCSPRPPECDEEKSLVCGGAT